MHLKITSKTLLNLMCILLLTKIPHTEIWLLVLRFSVIKMQILSLTEGKTPKVMLLLFYRIIINKTQGLKMSYRITILF